MSCLAPISWLRLERYELGELPATERQPIDAHLHDCADCSAALSHLRADERPLRPLPARPVRARERWLGWSFPALALAGAAAVVLLFPTDHWKGGSVSMQVVRERQGVVTPDAEGFLPGDRWKVLATCPPGQAGYWDVVIIDRAENQRDYPLSGGALTCGNQIALPGAFTLDGPRPLDVCLLLGDEPPRRDSSEPAHCVRLVPYQR
jgi:hypothetical protein